VSIITGLSVRRELTVFTIWHVVNRYARYLSKVVLSAKHACPARPVPSSKFVAPLLPVIYKQFVKYIMFEICLTVVFTSTYLLHNAFP